MELDFKNWLLAEVRYKGLYRMWKQKNNMPNYVGHDLYTHNVSSAMNNILKSNPHNSPGKRDQYSPIPSNSPDKIFDSKRAKEITDVNWSKSPEIINITPADLDDKTQEIMKMRNFGFKIFSQIPRDAQRMEIQKKLAIGDGKNEPVIMLKTTNGYKLIEGWHRTMNILLKGAPNNQIEMIKNGNYSKVEFTHWIPMKIRTFIGTEIAKDYEKSTIADKDKLNKFATSQTVAW